MSNKKELSQDIENAIKKNLPEATAGALKKRLAELEKSECQLYDLRKEHELLHEHASRLNAELDEHKRLDNREIDVEHREEGVEKAEIELSKRIAVHEAKEVMNNLRVNDHIQMFDRVFGNLQVRQHVLGDADNGQQINRTTTTVEK